MNCLFAAIRRVESIYRSPDRWRESVSGRCCCPGLHGGWQSGKRGLSPFNFPPTQFTSCSCRRTCVSCGLAPRICHCTVMESFHTPSSSPAAHIAELAQQPNSDLSHRSTRGSVDDVRRQHWQRSKHRAGTTPL